MSTGKKKKLKFQSFRFNLGDIKIKDPSKNIDDGLWIHVLSKKF